MDASRDSLTPENRRFIQSNSSYFASFSTAVQDNDMASIAQPQTPRPPRFTTTSVTNTLTAARSDIFFNPLTVDTLQPPLWKSQSDNSLISPGQLQGIVIESLKTPPIQGFCENSFRNGGGSLRNTGDRGGCASSSSSSSITGIRGNGRPDAFGGEMFEPEDSSEQRGVPWMLYRQRSQSAGAVPQLHSPAVAPYALIEGLNHVRSASAHSSFTSPQSPPQEHYARMAEIRGREEGNGDKSSFISSSPATPCPPYGANDTEYGSDQDDSSAYTDSEASGSECGYSQQRQRRNITQPMGRPGRAGTKSGRAAALSVSTESLNTATRSALATDGTGSMHFFNRHLRRVQQFRNVHIDAGMMASGPFSNIFSKPTLSPGLSMHSASTVVSQSSTFSAMTDSTAVSGGSHSSDYTFESPSIRDPHSPSGSTLCSQPQDQQPPQPRRLRECLNRAQEFARSCGDSENWVGQRRQLEYWTTQLHEFDEWAAQMRQKEYWTARLQELDSKTAPLRQREYWAAQLRELDGQMAPMRQKEYWIAQKQEFDQWAAQMRQKEYWVAQIRELESWATKTWQSLSSSPSSKPPASPVKSAQRPTLKELSGRSTRYHGKNTPPAAPALSSGLYYISGLSDHRNRKRATGVDAKTFFSNERTYIHWIKFGLLLGSMALTLLSFGKAVGLNVGLFLVLVAMSTLVYATAVFHLRHWWMIQMRQDVKFYDRVGPTLLFMALFLAFATNVVLTMHKIVGDYQDDEGYNFYRSGPLDV